MARQPAERNWAVRTLEAALRRHRRRMAQRPAYLRWRIEPRHLVMARSADEEDADRVLAKWQRGYCAMCGYRDHLQIDHDHDTGLIRGLLCVSCNKVEPNQAGGPWEVYRRRPPVALLGLRARYNQIIFGFAEPNPMSNLSDAEWLDQDPSYLVAAAIAEVGTGDE